METLLFDFNNLFPVKDDAKTNLISYYFKKCGFDDEVIEAYNSEKKNVFNRIHNKHKDVFKFVKLIGKQPHPRFNNYNKLIKTVTNKFNFEDYIISKLNDYYNA